MKCSPHRPPAGRLILAQMVLVVVSLRGAEPIRVPEIDLVLLPISSGGFLMGSPAGEEGRSDNEGPPTQVTIPQPFWLGRYEVTQGQWKALMDSGLTEQAQRMLADDSLYEYGSKKMTLRDIRGLAKGSDPKELVFNSNDDAPMYYVSWNEAVAFCHQLNEREAAAGRVPAGYEYRLPTEAEWEYACRAGTTGATYAGPMEIKAKYAAPVLDPIAWYGGNSSDGYTGKGIDTTWVWEKQYPGGTAAQRVVGMKRPNAWGLYDTLGNVWEWCGDWYAEKLPGGKVVDPGGPKTGSKRVFRGGSWFNSPRYERAASRVASPPGSRGHDLGFRVALAPVRS